MDQCFGLIKPAYDAHSIGIINAAQLLEDCGEKVCIAGYEASNALANIRWDSQFQILKEWIARHGITDLCMSYRLDPDKGVEYFNALHYKLTHARLLRQSSGVISKLFFAGLPEACEKIRSIYGDAVGVFQGDETPRETLLTLGIPERRIPPVCLSSSIYDEARMDLGQQLILSEHHRRIAPTDRSGYSSFGTRNDSMVARLTHARSMGHPPLLRAHVGPYDQDRTYALRQFNGWLRELSTSGFLDIVSIGTSQLTQERFGQEWEDRNNGGGVPVNSEEEYREIWAAARPMLVRTYAGTTRILEMASLHERSLNICWHALSLWWFCRIDGRGPNNVYDNLVEHLRTLDYIGTSGKPFEPNIPHHFAFRGSDDVSFVLSAYLAAVAAKKRGIKHLVLQVMLNTPRNTWGAQDLAKARAMLCLVRSLEDETFKVFLQPRAGLDYFSTDEMKARTQLAAVTMLMDDIDPTRPNGPDMIHVVSFSEAVELANPAVINESLQITLAALKAYRKAKVIDGFKAYSEEDVQLRTGFLIKEARAVLAVIERELVNPYDAEGLYRIFHAGFLPVPYLWGCREEFPNALAWPTKMVNGGVAVVDQAGHPIPARVRAEAAAQCLKFGPRPQSCG